MYEEPKELDMRPLLRKISLTDGYLENVCLEVMVKATGAKRIIPEHGEPRKGSEQPSR